MIRSADSLVGAALRKKPVLQILAKESAKSRNSHSPSLLGFQYPLEWIIRLRKSWQVLTIPCRLNPNSEIWNRAVLVVVLVLGALGFR